MRPAWTEDRAMLGSNPSADPGAKTEAGYREMPRCFWGRRMTSGLAQSDKSIKECSRSLFRFLTDKHLGDLGFGAPASWAALQHMAMMKEPI